MSDDITSEVTALSTKLIEAIDRQASLEDQIQSLRKELESTKREKTQLETKLSDGLLVDRAQYDDEVTKRQSAEKESARLEGEIEELTGSLFNEANKMVADAKRETADVLHRNGRLEAQLTEKDTLLESMKQQMDGLKVVLQDMTDQQEEQQHQQQELRYQESPSIGSLQGPQGAHQGTPKLQLGTAFGADSPRVTPRGDRDSRELEPSPIEHSPVDGKPPALTVGTDAAYSVTLSAPIRPILRRDLQAFSEFKALTQHFNFVQSIRTAAAASAMASTGLSGHSGHTGAGGSGGNDSPGSTVPGGPLHPPGEFGHGFSGSSALSTPGTYPPPSLKEFRFFKRALADDIEPTLRLEQAPGLSWLGRRSVMSSILDGTAVVEPISGINEHFKFIGNELVQAGTGQPPVTKQFASTLPVATKSGCKLCGESRNDSLLYARMHNLRVGKSKQDSSGGSFFSFGTENGTVGSSGSAASTSGVSGGSGSTGSGGASGDTGGGGGSGAGSAGGSDDVVSSGYPLCYYCVNRVRSVCDFVMFVRSIRDGVWKADDDISRARAWDECGRLRERMFWARIGGAYPTYMGTPSTPRSRRPVAPPSQRGELAARAENLSLRFDNLHESSDEEFEDSKESPGGDKTERDDQTKKGDDAQGARDDDDEAASEKLKSLAPGIQTNGEIKSEGEPGLGQEADDESIEEVSFRQME